MASSVFVISDELVRETLTRIEALARELLQAVVAKTDPIAARAFATRQSIPLADEDFGTNRPTPPPVNEDAARQNTNAGPDDFSLDVVGQPPSGAVAINSLEDLMGGLPITQLHDPGAANP